MNTTFTDGVTVVTAAWLNDVNDTVYDILGDGVLPPTTGAQVLTNIGGISATDIGVTIQAHSDNLDEFATVNPTAAGLALLDDADAAAQRTTLGLGSDATGTNLSSLTNTTTARTNLGLGTAATLDVGTTANKVVQLDGTAKLPAVDGSQLTNLPSTAFPSQTGNANKVLKTNGTNASWDSPLTSGTTINTTSGTAHTFTGIPSWVKRVQLLFRSVNPGGGSVLIIRLGAGSIVTSGYSGTATSFQGVGQTTESTTSYFPLTAASYTSTSSFLSGIVTFSKVSGNVWAMQGNLGRESTGITTSLMAGSIDLGGVLDRIQLTSVGGTEVFAAGSINILYE